MVFLEDEKILANGSLQFLQGHREGPEGEEIQALFEDLRPFVRRFGRCLKWVLNHRKTRFFFFFSKAFEPEKDGFFKGPLGGLGWGFWNFEMVFNGSKKRLEYANLKGGSVLCLFGFRGFGWVTFLRLTYIYIYI